MTDEGDERSVLERALAEAVRRFDAVPDEVVAAAKATFTWRTIDAELAALTADSLTDDATLAGVRGTAVRTLTFEAEGLVIDVEVAGQPGGVALTGQVMADNVEAVEVQHADEGERTPVAVDALGRFRADVAPGPVRLWCRFGPHPPRSVATEWLMV